MSRVSSDLRGTTVLVHGGWPKTGTTAFQEWLRCWPNMAGAPFERPGGARAETALRALWSDADAPPDALAQLLRTSIQDPTLPVVLSYEALVGLPMSWTVRGHVGMGAVAERLVATGADVRWLLTVRDAAALVRSTYLHEVRRGLSSTYADFLAMVEDDRSRGAGPLAVARVVDDIAEIVGPDRVVVAPLSDVSGDPASFWAALGRHWDLPLRAPASGRLPQTNATVVGPPRLERFLNRRVLRSYVTSTRPRGRLPLRVRRPVRRPTVNRVWDRMGRDWSASHFRGEARREADLAAALQGEIDEVLVRHGFGYDAPADATAVDTSARVHLPLMTASRDLDGRLVLGVELARRGLTSVIGYTAPVVAQALASPPGVFVTPTLVPAAADRLRRLRERGHAVVGWDEEGLVYPDPLWYFRNRMAGASLDQLDALVVWGEASAADVRAAFPGLRCPVHPLGNPRTDLFRSPAIAVFEDMARRIREEEGPFVLINTNFDLVNHADGPDGLQVRLRSGGRISGPDDEAAYARWAVLRRAVMDAFVEGMASLAAALPDHRIVVRPHPSEDASTWEEATRSLPSVVVRPAGGPVAPWLLASDVVLHNSCTTAVEAFLAGRPVVAYVPPGDASAMESPLPNQVSLQGRSWGEVVAIVSDVVRSWDGPTEEQVAVARRHLSATDGPLASEGIAAFLDEARSRVLPVRSAARRELIRRVGRRLAARARPATPPSRDVHQRHPPIDAEEVRARVTELARRLGVAVVVSVAADGTFTLGPAIARGDGEDARGGGER